MDTIYVPPNFWVLMNSEMSSGNWPSILGDNTPNIVDHSFFSDDMIVWEPYLYGDYYVRAYFTPDSTALREITRGEIKALF
ncbi:hypothetical protein GF402_11555 [Candidatus Fermentibacteria bacterium]|nr:hypothetical protein [Candidatus Fermentibacteria bacterium]